MLNEMKTKLQRDMLRFHVGQVIFCPRCRSILDARRAIEFDFYKDGNLLSTKVLCATCGDEGKGLIGTLPEGVTVEFVDGRELFAQDAPKVKAPKAPPAPDAVAAKDVAVGDVYAINHSSGWTKVAVLAITGHRHLNTRSGLTPPRTKRFICKNLKTGREITVKSAAKFHRIAQEAA